MEFRVIHGAVPHKSQLMDYIIIYNAVIPHDDEDEENKNKGEIKMRLKDKEESPSKDDC